MKKRVGALFLITILIVGMLSTVAVAATDFNGRQSSTYSLSNGKQVRIEYHGGQPHYHELDDKGQDLGSENLNDDNAHHNDGKKPSKSTRDIVKGDKQKSQGDKNAKKKADELKKKWEEAEKNAENASQDFITKNQDTIAKAAEAGSVVIVVGGVVYALWWLLKLASGWGILLPV